MSRWLFSPAYPSAAFVSVPYREVCAPTSVAYREVAALIPAMSFWFVRPASPSDWFRSWPRSVA